MNLVLTADLTKEILRLSQNDTRLLHTLAREWVRRIPIERLYGYLLQGNVAADLLAQRLKDNPTGTLHDLEKLAGGKVAKKSAGKKRKASIGKPKPGKRLRLSADQVAKLKSGVVDFLRQAGWATRKQISDAAGIPTPSLYNRIIAELREEKKLAIKGEKARRVYALAGSKKSKKKAAKKSAKRKVSKKAKTKRHARK